MSVFVLLATFPLYCKATPYYDGPLAVLSKAIGGLGALLPGFLSYWLKSYQSHPGYFLVIASALAVTLYVASRLQDRIFDKMRTIFDNPLPADATEATPPPTGVIYYLQSNKKLKKFFKWMKEKFIPGVILIIVAMFILRGISIILDSSGFLSKPTSGNLKGELFPSRNLSWASGHNLEKGKRYRITLAINSNGQDQWKDKTIPATAGGFEKLYLIPFIPFRRHITEPWFKPIARIGAYGNDDYPLNAEDGSDDNTLISEITARKSGELFLFVNDAILPIPTAWQFFYINNEGTARVKVEPLD